MPTTTTTTRTVRPTVPAMPGSLQHTTATPRRPGRPASSVAAAAAPPVAAPAATATPRRPGRPAPAVAPPVAAPAVDAAALMAAMNGQKNEIARLTALIAKLQASASKTWTREQILAAGDSVAEDDPRRAYHGVVQRVLTFHHDRKDRLIPASDGRTASVLLAIPSDDDPGGMGPTWRAQDCLAVWAGARTDGTYSPNVAYVSMAELDALWID